MIFVDNKEVEWADFRMSIDGSDAMAKVVGLKFGVKVDLEELYAGGDEAIAIQAGNKSKTGTLKILKGGFDVMHDAALAAGGRDITDIAWVITGKFRAQGSRNLRLFTMTGIRVSEWAIDEQQGEKKVIVELPFMCLTVTIVAA